MFAAPFGLAAAAKARTPSVPLWLLVLAAQAIDLLGVILRLTGIESQHADPDPHTGYGDLLFNDSYSHALLTAIILAMIFAAVGRRYGGVRAGATVGGLVLAHWLLDLLFHRGDLPILPGNAGNLPTFGFGLWSQPTVAALVEAGIVLAGAFLYYRSAIRLPAPSIRASAAYRTQSRIAALVTAGLLLLTLAAALGGFDL
ncbi:MAG: permease [Chloroflexota bacterium]|nr:permease [Chloroflexota bacterium]